MKPFSAHDPSEDAAIAEAIAGRPGALDYIVRKYRNYIYTLIVRNGFYGDEADELFQEVFLRLTAKIQKFRPGGSFKNWLFTLALNLVRNHRRRKKLFSIFRPLSSEDEAVTGIEAGPESQAGRSMEERAVGLAMAELPVAMFRILFLHYYEDKKYHEIARELKVPEGTVKIWIHRAKNALETKLKQKGARLV